MASLVTLIDLKFQLNIDDPDRDMEIDRIGNRATAIVIDYIKRPEHGWIVSTVPAVIQTSILLVAESLFDGHPDVLSKKIKELLMRYRDPAVA